jgi:cytochrome c peroxidase
MYKLKLAIITAFIFAFAAVSLWRSTDVSGQTGTLAAPTGVLATDNLYNNKIGVYWDVIRNATAYRIFRNTVNDTSTATDLGTTAAPFFFNTTAVPGTTYFFWVRAENATTISPLSAIDTGSRTAPNAPIPGVPPPLNPPPPAPVGNNLTAAKAYLGKVLFWDEQMSATRTVSCGTCHHSGSGGTDPRSLVTNPGPDGVLANADDIHGSAGVPSNNADGRYVNVATYGINDQVTGRRTVAYVNAAYAPVLFWDGRATGIFSDPVSGSILLNGGGALESQSAGPPVATAEMGSNGRSWTDVATRIAESKPLALSTAVPTPLMTWINGRSYPDLFAEAFGTPDVTPSRIAFAIATFERTLFSDQAPVDLDAAGIAPLSAAAQRGRGVFNANGCNACHAGSLFSDQSFRDIGVRPSTEDTGRFQVTGNNADTGTFRVPSLRNVALRHSYFHNGDFTTLNQVVAFYNRGGDFPTNPNFARGLVRPLGLGAGQQNDLVAFLQSLTDPRVANETAPFDRPTLYMESNRVPLVGGVGRAGSGGSVPTIRAISPPIVGNLNFTISLSNALGNATATLIVYTFDPGATSSVPTNAGFARIVTSTQASGAGNGWTSAVISIPNDSSLVGKTVFARWYIQDPGAQNGLAVSQVASFTVFGDGSTQANPYDDARFFVHQHYLDFLNREPDQSGWDFWTNTITECGADAACTEVHRINVSAAYFLSNEFQNTGYLAYLTHRSAFGATAAGSPVPVLYSTFKHDVQELGNGYVFLQPGADAVLESNKVAYFNEFVNRSEFLSRYPASLANPQFVDNLLTTANLSTSGTFRDSLLNGLNNGTMTRASVLRAIAESDTLHTRELNAAFVAMEYFGYLRRDPDTAGYNFWLQKLNTFNGDYIAAEMVKAFIESSEVRQRFAAN